MTSDKENGFERLKGVEIVGVQNRNKFVAREKTKYKMKIRGKKRVKWGKRKEEQNIRFEINYNIKSSDLKCTHLKDKK